MFLTKNNSSIFRSVNITEVNNWTEDKIVAVCMMEYTISIQKCSLLGFYRSPVKWKWMFIYW